MPAPGAPRLPALDAIDRRLLDGWQRDFPLEPHPFARLASEIGITEAEVLARLHALRDAGMVGRIGAVVRPHTAGCSTLAAVAVAPERLDAVGTEIAALATVNHCYEREHALNLWFVVAAEDEAAMLETMARAAAIAQAPVHDLRLRSEYRIDLGFPLQWN
ncbi:MAG: Lrp/AsnC family transcriptional regulator [Alphaproteobacteria bacterium]|nr:Lrp/AsnC family transcriptional regulator [Alphaproteobacteria bacterium]